MYAKEITTHKNSVPLLREENTSQVWSMNVW